MTNQNLAEDFKLLRNQVAVDKYTDQDLKTVFQKNNYDIVDSLLEIEKSISGREAYNLNTKELTETEKKIKELREIANQKDILMSKIK
jgi:hypothetical protein